MLDVYVADTPRRNVGQEESSNRRAEAIEAREKVRRHPRAERGGARDEDPGTPTEQGDKGFRGQRLVAGDGIRSIETANDHRTIEWRR